MVIEISDLVSKSWEKFSKNMVNNILVILVGSIAAALLGALTLGILSMPIMGGMVKAYRKAQRGDGADFGDLFSEFGNFSKWFMLWLLYIGLGIITGITFGLAGIAAGFLLYFTIHLMIDKDMGAFDAAKESFSYVSGNFGAVFVPILVAMLISGAGSIVIYIGALVTVPWMMIASWDIYDAAFKAGGTTETASDISPSGGPV